jgi:branched-subunit amino acid aminotransferase/4-amino-4-deoxychorismate lyase
LWQAVNGRLVVHPWAPTPDGVFETLRLQPDGSIWALARHWARLQRGLSALELECPADLTPETLISTAHRLATANRHLGTGRLRLAVARAEPRRGWLPTTRTAHWHLTLDSLEYDATPRTLPLLTSPASLPYRYKRIADPRYSDIGQRVAAAGWNDALLLDPQTRGVIETLHGAVVYVLKPEAHTGLVRACPSVGLPSVALEVLLTTGTVEPLDTPPPPEAIEELHTLNAVRGAVPIRTAFDLENPSRVFEYRFDTQRSDHLNQYLDIPQ